MEDKKGLVQSTFEYILFDMDTDRITDFRLKPWADQYVMIRAEMIVEEHGEMLQNGRDSQVDLRGFRNTSLSYPKRVAIACQVIVQVP